VWIFSGRVSRRMVRTRPSAVGRRTVTTSKMMEDGPLAERAFETVEGNLDSCQQDIVAPEVFGTQVVAAALKAGNRHRGIRLFVCAAGLRGKRARIAARRRP